MDRIIIYKKVKTFVLTTILLTFSGACFAFVGEDCLKSARQYLSYYKSNGESSNLNKSVNFYNQLTLEILGLFPFVKNLTQINFANLSVKSPAERAIYLNDLISQLENIIKTEEDRIKTIKTGLNISSPEFKDELNIVKILPTIEKKLEALDEAINALNKPENCEMRYFELLIKASCAIKILEKDENFYNFCKSKNEKLEDLIEDLKFTLQSEKQVSKNDFIKMIDNCVNVKVLPKNLYKTVKLALQEFGFDEQVIAEKLKVVVDAIYKVSSSKKSFWSRLWSKLFGSTEDFYRPDLEDQDEEISDQNKDVLHQEEQKTAKKPAKKVVLTAELERLEEISEVLFNGIYKKSLNIDKLDFAQKIFVQNANDDSIQSKFETILSNIYVYWNHNTLKLDNEKDYKKVLGAFEAYLTVNKKNLDLIANYKKMKKYFVDNIAKPEDALTVNIAVNTDLDDAENHTEGPALNNKKSEELKTVSDKLFTGFYKKSINMDELDKAKEIFTQNAENALVQAGFEDILLNIYEYWKKNTLTLDSNGYNKVLAAFECYVAKGKNKKNIIDAYAEMRKYRINKISTPQDLQAEIDKLISNSNNINIKQLKDLSYEDPNVSAEQICAELEKAEHKKYNSLKYLPLIAQGYKLQNATDDKKEMINEKLKSLKATHLFSKGQLIGRLKAISKNMNVADINLRRSVKAIVELATEFEAREHKLAICLFLMRYNFLSKNIIIS